MDVTRISHQDPRSDRSELTTTRRGAVRRNLLAALILSGTVGLTSSGCAGRSMSLASMNPFKGKSAETSVTETPSKLVSTTSKIAGGTVTASKNAVSKTSSTVGGWFKRDKSDGSPEDPLSLENTPQKLEPEVFVANGQLWESTGNLTKAMESYSKALETAPNNGPALTSIARLHFREGNYPKSAEFFQKAIAQTPNDAAIYNDLGLTLSKLNQHEMAAQTLQRALDLAPGTSRYANNLASVYFESGKTDEALRVLKANNKPAVAHFNMAFLHYKKGQSALAQAQLTQSLAYENESSADPATKRAIDRSREMLAQMNPSNSLPGGGSRGGLPADIPNEYGPAAGPSAIIAANPAHRATQQPPQVLGQVTPPTGPAVNMTPHSYQDPRSYMMTQMPLGPNTSSQPPFSPQQPSATTPPFTVPNRPSGVPMENPAVVPTTPATPPTATPNVTQPAAAALGAPGFALPGSFQLPAN